MTSEIPARDPDTEPFGAVVASAERKRAALVLGVLAVVAVLVVGLIFLLGSSGSSPKGTSAGGPSGPAVTVTGGAPDTSAPPSTSKPSTPSSAPSSSANTSGPVSCPTSAPCALADDVGNVVQALNDYRKQHGRSAVTGSITKAAKKCVVRDGDSNACPTSYFWEPVGRSGTQVIDKIASGGRGGKGWLTDPKMTEVQLAWAYLPASKSFQCVVVSNA